MTNFKRFIIIVTLVAAFISSALFIPASFVYAQYAEDLIKFSLSNPDGRKYDFVKTYIMALEYLYHNEKARERKPGFNSNKLQNLGLLADEDRRLIQANLNLRISKNLLDRFESTENSLMRKAVKIFKEYADKQVELNNQERVLVKTVKEKVMVSKALKEATVIWYSEGMVDIARARKESSMDLLESALLVNKVLISHEFDQNGELYKLGITEKQRDNLIWRLRAFRDDKFKGEPRSGQTFLEASVSAIRELLEDPSWPASKDVS